MSRTFDIYQGFTAGTAIYPGAGEGTTEAVAYCALGLAGEAGEIANKAKKLMRDGEGPAARRAIRSELGDVLWYLARIADELGVPLSQVADGNEEKLRDRQARGVLGGSGDHR